ncbi:hypothetical protein M011DRAFT_529144 [Sporormia fimetaria CBS 119925]|uniref:Uncharacterized protein n=1 Tax=Sporormia fimetaria CBS 119925 TaxID=1340428 RepID=A0A6A6V0F0_9PLEO|nr:hypothetical protein M011DRAFT_529144 [Sporormia fimetaria CBS 119925]
MRTSIFIALLLSGLATATAIPLGVEANNALKNDPCTHPNSVPYSSGQDDGDKVSCKDGTSGAIYLKYNVGVGDRLVAKRGVEDEGEELGRRRIETGILKPGTVCKGNGCKRRIETGIIKPGMVVCKGKGC